MPKITTQSIHAIPFLGYIKNPLGSIIDVLKPKGVLHSHSKTWKESNTLMGILCKHHGLNYFGSGYQKGIVHAYNYLMHVQYPFQGI